MAASRGPARGAGLRVTAPLTATWPSTIRRSPPRREVSPAWARILLSLSFAMLGDDRQLRHHQLALDLGQVADVPKAERDQELARGLEQVGPTRRFLPAGDAHESPLEQVVEHALGVHTADRIDLGTRHRLLVRDDRQGFQRRTRQAGARSGAGQPDEPGRGLRPGDHAIAATPPDDLQPPARRVLGRAGPAAPPARLAPP